MLEADKYRPTMSNQMTLMDGEVSRSLPDKEAREQGTRSPIKVPAEASSHESEISKQNIMCLGRNRCHML